MLETASSGLFLADPVLQLTHVPPERCRLAEVLLIATGEVEGHVTVHGIQAFLDQRVPRLPHRRIPLALAHGSKSRNGVCLSLRNIGQHARWLSSQLSSIQNK